MSIDPIMAMYWAGLWFSIGVLFCELTKAPKRCKRRLRVYYLRGDDGLVFRVRCRPGAFRRMLAKIEDESCEGR